MPKKKNEIKAEDKVVEKKVKEAKDQMPTAKQDPNEEKGKAKPKFSNEPKMNKVIADKFAKVDEKKPSGDYIDPEISELKKDIKKTLDIVEDLEKAIAGSVDEDQFAEIEKYLNEEDDEEEIPEDVPEVDEIPAPDTGESVDDNEDIDIEVPNDDELNIDDTGEDGKTQAVVTIDMPEDSDVDTDDISVDVNKVPADDETEPNDDEFEPDVPMEDMPDTEEPDVVDDEEDSDVEIDATEEADKKPDDADLELPEINDDEPEDNEDEPLDEPDDLEFDDDEKELMDSLNKFVQNMLAEEKSEDDEACDDDKDKKKDDKDKKTETSDELADKVLEDEYNDDIIENTIKQIDAMIAETQMDDAKKNVEKVFEDPDEKAKNKKEEVKESDEPREELLPIAENATWSAIAASKRVYQLAAKEDTTIDFDVLKEAHLYVDEGSEQDIDAYRYQIADCINGKLYAIPGAIKKLTDLFSNDITLRSLHVSEDVVKDVREKLGKYLEAMGEEIPWNETSEDGATVRFQEANGLLSIYSAFQDFDPSAIFTKLQENEKK
jgi:hypothetical protein